MLNIEREAFNAAETARMNIVRLMVERDTARAERDVARIERDNAMSTVASQAMEISELKKGKGDEIPDL